MMLQCAPLIVLLLSRLLFLVRRGPELVLIFMYMIILAPFWGCDNANALFNAVIS